MIRLLGSLLTCWYCVAYVHAAEQSWAELAAKAKQVEFSSEEAESDFQDARVALQQTLKDYRRQSQRVKNIEGWNRYLAIEELEGLVAGELDAKRLRELYRRFVAGHPGLQRELFRQIREPLQRLTGLAETVAQEDAAEQFAEQTKKLAEALQAYDAEPSEEHLQAIQAATHWLARSDQAEELVNALQQRFGRPNLQTRLGAEFVSRFVEKPVERTTPVRDVILGTRIRGTGTTFGQTRFELLPAEGFLRGQIVVNGTTHAQTVGRNEPATIYSSSRTEFTSAIEVQLSPGRSDLGSPQTQATTCSRTRCVTTDVGFPFRRLGKKIATKRVAENKPKADRIAARHAETRLNREILEQTQPLMDKLREGFEDRFENRLQRLGLYPEEIQLSSSSAAWTTMATVTAPGQLAATSAPPQLGATYPATTWLHQSMTLNAGQRLSGRTINNDEFRQFVRDLLNREPEPDPEAENNTITFAEQDPFELRFAEGGVTLFFRAQSFYQEGRSIIPLNISARYELAIEDGKLSLSRGEDAVKVTSPTGRLSLRESAQKNLVRKRFERLLKPQFTLDPIDMSASWSQPGQLVPVEVIADDGWLAIGWEIADLQTAE